MLRNIIFILAICQLTFWSSASSAQNISSDTLTRQDFATSQAKKHSTKKLAQVRLNTRNNRQDVAPLLQGQNKVDANAGTVTIMTTRNLGAPFMKLALDLSTLLDEGERFEKMRIIPVVSRGKVQNLWDILYLKGIDIGFVQTDVLQFLKNDPRLGSIKRRIRYISVMFPEEVHIIAHKSIRSLKDLEGKKISINAKGTGSSIVGTLLFKRLGIKATLINEDTARAIARIKSGELAAHFNVLGKPARPVLRIKSEGKLHILPIPYSKEVRGVYFPSKFTSKDYPNLIEPGKTVQTIAAGNVLAVFNWPKDSSRYKKVARFVDAFFGRFEELKKPGFHRKWGDINLAASMPGWTRFPAAQEWLDKNLKRKKPVPVSQNRLKDEFYAFMRANGIASSVNNRRQMQAMFERFLEWRQTQR